VIIDQLLASVVEKVNVVVVVKHELMHAVTQNASENTHKHIFWKLLWTSTSACCYLEGIYEQALVT